MSFPAETQLILTTPDDPRAQELMDEQQRELAARYGDDDDPEPFDPAALGGSGGAVLLALEGTRPVGCGALRPLLDPPVPGTAEVKRMYVRPEARRRGLARRILTRLEEQARALGYTQVWLETGTGQPEAMRLYETSGYQRIARYGYYANHPLSVCYGKTLQEG
ncbi:GNAT superfamily N-acetyltransferase [Deinobacterium chartae]|uniref:GNAT superfamily N-acetyltransferase n=1 Tax=Deinobacterium chartae TaxID=521158 RepID=A0A841I4T5_9DEIO|nr:GNAT family N-acetyltransferase [Deinobacterium chartae]MBB6100044.1 GNAT superfamily N-acetyltransferase [Deinobacterium chartae]